MTRWVYWFCFGLGCAPWTLCKVLRAGHRQAGCSAPSFGDSLRTVLMMDRHNFNLPGLEQPQTAGFTRTREASLPGLLAKLIGRSAGLGHGLDQQPWRTQCKLQKLADPLSRAQAFHPHPLPCPPGTALPFSGGRVSWHQGGEGECKGSSRRKSPVYLPGEKGGLRRPLLLSLLLCEQRELLKAAVFILRRFCPPEVFAAPWGILLSASGVGGGGCCGI